jgi:histidinol dehydrogenase
MSKRNYPPVAIHTLATLSADARAELLARSEENLESFMQGAAPIIEAVRSEGDAALVHYSKQFDHADINVDQIAATKTEIDNAFDALDAAFIEVLEYAADNIRRFQQEQMPGDMWMKEIRPGVLVGERYTPIDSVACYSPRGKGSFPSVTLMTAIPAVVAGVPDAMVLTPPGPDGNVDPATLVAARLAGIEQVYKAGGVQAVAAAAYGTQTIPECKKIVGPGSPWLVAAKRLLSGVIDPGLPAGPSETIVMADPSANPLIAALDLLIESEHGSDSSAFLVTWDKALAEKAAAAIPGYWDTMSDTLAGFSSDVLSGTSGGIVLTEDAESAYAFINDYAPEHCQVLSQNPFEHLSHIRNASEILLGEHAAGSLANYIMGPNCVLPTSGAANTYSPLGVHDFMKSASVGHVTKQGYDQLAQRVHRFATYEGFDAHANSVSSLRDDAFNNKPAS